MRCGGREMPNPDVVLPSLTSIACHLRFTDDDRELSPSRAEAALRAGRPRSGAAGVRRQDRAYPGATGSGGRGQGHGPARVRLHQLTGDMKGFWSVTVSANWRIVFRFDHGRALDV